MGQNIHFMDFKLRHGGKGMTNSSEANLSSQQSGSLKNEECINLYHIWLDSGYNQNVSDNFG